LDLAELRQVRARDGLRAARLATVASGVGLFVWGLVPAVWARLQGEEVSATATLATGGPMFVIAGLFLLLAAFMGRRNWPLWAALVLAVTLVALPVLTAWAAQAFSQMALFPLFLATLTAFTCGGALVVRQAR